MYVTSVLHSNAHTGQKRSIYHTSNPLIIFVAILYIQIHLSFCRFQQRISAVGFSLDILYSDAHSWAVSTEVMYLFAFSGYVPPSYPHRFGLGPLYWAEHMHILH